MKLMLFWRKSVKFSVTILIIYAYSCSGDKQNRSNIPIAAWVGDTIITNDEMQFFLKRFIVERGINIPSTEAEKQKVRLQCLNELAKQYVLEREGKKRGFVLPNDLKDPGEILDHSKQYPDAFQLLEKDKEAWKNALKHDFALLEISARLAEEFAQKVSIPDQLIKKTYEQNLDAYRVPEKYTVRIIRVLDADLARDIKNKLKKGWKFIRLAETYSTLRGKGAKGKLITQPLSEFPAEFHAELQSLKRNQISPIMLFEEQYYIIKMIKKEKSKTIAYDDVRESIRNELKSKKVNELFKAWLDSQLSMVTVRIGTPVPFPGENG